MRCGPGLRSPFYGFRNKDFRSHLLVAAIALLMAPNGFAGAPMAAATDNTWQAAPQVSPGVPSDLKPLLAPRTSEMRLVVTRYELDRATLSANYANGGGRGAAARAMRRRWPARHGWRAACNAARLGCARDRAGDRAAVARAARTAEAFRPRLARRRWRSSTPTQVVTPAAKTDLADAADAPSPPTRSSSRPTR